MPARHKGSSRRRATAGSELEMLLCLAAAYFTNAQTGRSAKGSAQKVPGGLTRNQDFRACSAVSALHTSTGA